MAKFEFRLQTVLSYREQVEEARKMELRSLEEFCRREQQALEELEQEKEFTQGAMAEEEGREKLDLAVIEEYLVYVQLLERAIARQRALVEELEKRLEEKRAEVIEAMQERKVLGKLRDRQERRAEIVQMREETKLIDEVATAQFSRGGTSP